ncbi:uncharacterized protein LOC126896145 [Daktulosphaira vitifoliae]|uniref:uncharacterized protein LOC126896145 n=1 Tax=Daktulosphaira vitifoliae TaxID=58002 RepID=UPI0021AA930F|nr:uncharacterized protein LOC126896145 [Daktulosphaira vitifoliae]XP_050524606.1 uncharacterized protein LOC126896145 [Daktulosphaira vitifoliae]XP_050524607.1 uncharacterized protein LOC126896145 [Daktulosphaira vitifoliae]
MQTPKFVPVFAHNMNYDKSFIIGELGFDAHTLSVVPNSEEKFIFFSKYISNKFSVRFLDTFKFMSSSLDALSANLARSDKTKFKSVMSAYQSRDLDLVFRKGVFCYEYMNSWEKLEERSLPPIEEFYSSLTEKHILPEDYAHAQNVWQRFNHQTLKDYVIWYNELDVHLLCDVFEAFRDLCLSTYGLDPCFYYTAPGLSFDAMLKITKVELELLTDYDMLLFIENGIRGGITQAVKRYAKANNKFTTGYDASEPSSWLIYLDATNLYGWGMSQALPRKNFRWYEKDISVSAVTSLLKRTGSNSNTGYIMEVDVDYPQTLHDAHSDLPYLCERFMPPGAKISKLCTTLINKKNYTVHYTVLKQAMDAGLKLKNVHRVLQFEQSAWLSKYIKVNTEKRKLATNDFFKLMNNAVFGKTMESCRNRMKINVLEISKTLMYDFHYNTMRKMYNGHIELCYMDTDSLIYFIHTEDFYDDVLKKPGFLEKLDTSNLDPNHKCYRTERAKLPGTFTDEALGKIIAELIALRSKSYGYEMDGKEKIKAKGVSKIVVSNHVTLMDHKQCLFKGLSTPHIQEVDDNYSAEREMISFRSIKHKMKTIKTRKLALNRYDDKRIVLPNQIDTLPHGHYKVEKLIEEGKL